MGHILTPYEWAQGEREWDFLKAVWRAGLRYLKARPAPPIRGLGWAKWWDGFYDVVAEPIPHRIFRVQLGLPRGGNDRTVMLQIIPRSPDPDVVLELEFDLDEPEREVPDWLM